MTLRRKNKRRTIKKRNKRMNKRRTIKKRNKRMNKKGGTDYDDVNCCLCEEGTNIKDNLIPRACLSKFGSKAHRICSKCWWDPNEGFAKENAPHGCPGCAKNFPLTKVPDKKTELVQTIDLTEE